jgi:hypothetical protein
MQKVCVAKVDGAMIGGTVLLVGERCASFVATEKEWCAHR